MPRSSRLKRVGRVREEDSYECSSCEFVTPSVTGISLHMRAKHGILRPTEVLRHKCARCGDGFANGAALGDHISRSGHW